VKPESRKHFEKAERCLANGSAELAAAASRPELAEDAARNAYLAAFHAAKALIFERTGQARMKHGTVQKMFSQIAKSESAIEVEVRRFLGSAYDFKRVADYDIEASAPISLAEASHALNEAERFVATIKTLVP
jgi:uncharacterized protein (UPF0332 family)